jgi:hypothetical protein
MPPIMSAVPDRHLVVVAPRLFAVDDGTPKRRLPALEQFLARADRLPPGPVGFHATLFGLFGAEAEEGDLPIAALTRFHDMGVVDREWWLRADPVNLIPERDRLVLSDQHSLNLTQPEADALVAELMQTYGPDGWLIKAPRPDRWYAKPPRPANIRTTPLADTVGRDIHPLLPRGPDARAWHTILNEFQILLHAAGTNAEREDRNALPVNSVWFWGGGYLPRVSECAWAAIWSHDPVGLAFARLCGRAYRDLPAEYAAWEKSAEPGRHLVVLEPDSESHPSRIESSWIWPAREALRAGRLTSLTLHDDTGAAFLATARHLRRWWRRQRPIATYCAPVTGTTA